MLKLKNKNGITLIALIITIIVMLILVGVTVSVSLNGGLFDKAKDAADQTQIAADADSLQAAALGAMGTDGKVDCSKITGFTRNEDGTFTSSNGYRFTVDDNGNVTYVGEGTGGDGSGSGTETESRLGAYVTYGGLTWRVIKDDSSGVELLSENAIGGVTIGNNLSGSDDEIINKFNEIELSLLEECVYESGITWAIRSVGIEDRAIVESLGLLDAGAEYWVNYTESYIKEDVQGPVGITDFEYYVIYFVDSEGSISQETLFMHDMNYGGCYGFSNSTKGVRPVVTLQTGALDNATGNGSSGQPYVLGS